MINCLNEQSAVLCLYLQNSSRNFILMRFFIAKYIGSETKQWYSHFIGII